MVGVGGAILTANFVQNRVVKKILKSLPMKDGMGENPMSTL
jgi:hypothetical protein